MPLEYERSGCVKRANDCNSTNYNREFMTEQRLLSLDRRLPPTRPGGRLGGCWGTGVNNDRACFSVRPRNDRCYRLFTGTLNFPYRLSIPFARNVIYKSLPTRPIRLLPSIRNRLFNKSRNRRSISLRPTDFHRSPSGAECRRLFFLYIYTHTHRIIVSVRNSRPLYITYVLYEARTKVFY